MANDTSHKRPPKEVGLPPIPLTPEQALFAALNTKPPSTTGKKLATKHKPAK